MSVWASWVRQAIATLDGEAAQLHQGLDAVERCRDHLRALLSTPPPGNGAPTAEHLPEGGSAGAPERLRAALAALDGEAVQFRQAVAAAAHCQEQLAAILAARPEDTAPAGADLAADAGDRPVPSVSPAPPAPPAAGQSPPPAPAAPDPLRPLRWARPAPRESHVAALGLKRGAINGLILTFLSEMRVPVEAHVVAAAMVEGRIDEGHPSYRYVFDTLVPTALGRMVQQGRLVRHKVRNRYHYGPAPGGGPRRR